MTTISRSSDWSGKPSQHCHEVIRAKEYSVLYITPSERLALQLLAEGRPRGDVANALSVCPASLGERLSVLFARMDVTGEREAVASALRRGLLVVEIAVGQSAVSTAQASGRRAVRLAVEELVRAAKKPASTSIRCREPRGFVSFTAWPP